MITQKAQLKLQWCYVIASSAWFASPVFAELPTLAKCAPIFLGCMLGTCVFASPKALAEANVFSAYALLGLLYSVIVAGLIKEDTPLALQINMLFVGMLAYYLATPFPMNPLFVVWIIALVVMPSALANALINSGGLQSILGAFTGRRSEFTIFGGTHHVMGAMGALAILAAANAYQMRKAGDGSVRLHSIVLASAVGCGLLLSSGARAFVFGLVITYFCAVFVRMLVLVAPLLACSIPLLIVPLIYGATYIINTMPDLAVSAQLPSDVEIVDVTTGRIPMWEQHMALFMSSPIVGHRLADIEPERVFDGVGEGGHYIAADGSIMTASTESLFDYILARDGLTGILTISFYFSLYVIGILQKKQQLWTLMLFTIVSSIGQPLLRITYVLESFVLSVMVVQAYRYSSGVDCLANRDRGIHNAGKVSCDAHGCRIADT